MKSKLFVCVYLVALSVFAQSYKHFSIEQGLLSNRVYKVLQDTNGFIWMATDKGLSKFDGKNFTNFTTANGLSSNDIWDIALTNDNKIWYFTRANALGYVLNDSVYNFKANNEIFYPNFINRYKDNIGFLSHSSRYFLEDNKWKISNRDTTQKINSVVHPYLENELLKDNNIKIVQKDYAKESSINVFRGQINDSIISYYYNDKKLLFINIFKKKFHIIANDTIFGDYVSALTTHDAIQVSGNGFFAKLNKNYQLYDIQLFDKKLQANRIFQDNQDNYWIATYNKGVLFISKNALSSKTYLKNHKLHFVKVINNELFAGVNFEGIYKYNRKKDVFELYFPISDYIYDIVMQNEFLIVYANLKTYYYSKNQNSSIFRFGKTSTVFNNKYYVIINTGIKVFSNERKILDTIPINDVNDMLLYNNSLMIANTTGVYQINTNDYKKILDSSLNYNAVLSINKIDKKLLIGTDGNGLHIWDGQSAISSVNETENMIINDIYVKDSIVWVSGQKGLMEFKYVNNDLKFKRILLRNDGLISEQINNMVVFDNQIFACDYNGISSTPINQESKNTLQSIYFYSVSYSGEKEKDNNVYEYQSNNLFNINFGIIDYCTQENNKIFYKLEPLQKKWVPTHSNQISFNDLQPGEYNFQLKVVNLNKQQLFNNYSFVVKPLWWQTFFAKMIFALLVAVLFLYLGYFYRKRLTKKRNETLLMQKQMAEHELHALRSQMNPHFVFNSLNAILYYINDENFDQSEAYLIKFSRLIRMIFDYSREKYIHLKDEIDLLKTYLELEKLRFGDDFNYCLNIDNKIDVINFDLPTMLLQPIVENAVNHGLFHKDGKGIICLHFQCFQKNSIIISISDDGVGVEQSKEFQQQSLKKHVSKSTQILKERIKLLNMSGKWLINYQLNDLSNKKTRYNTEVILKITRL